MPADSYQFIEQPGATPDAPLLVLLHGTGGNEQQFLALGPQLAPGARILAIRGDVSEGGALRYFRRTGEGVYDMADLARATGKLAAFLRERRGAASSVLGFGYSNGANILASVLFSHPETVERAALLHPLIPFVPPPQPGLGGRRVLVTAGQRDPIAPLAASEALVAYFRAQGATVEASVHPGGHELVQQELVAARGFFSAS